MQINELFTGICALIKNHRFCLIFILDYVPSCIINNAFTMTNEVIFPHLNRVLLLVTGYPPSSSIIMA